MDNKESISDREIAEITIMLEFIKNIKDLLHALDETFHDKIHENIINDEVYNYFYNYNDEITVDSFKNIEFFNYSTSLFEFCVKIFPNKFFDILYENEEIFTNDELDVILSGLYELQENHEKNDEHFLSLQNLINKIQNVL